MGSSRRTRISLGAAGLVVLAALALAPPARAADGWTWPVEGRVLTPYANDNARPYAGGMHRGIDIAAKVGTAVRAARAGEVTFVGAVGSSGLTVSIRTTDGRYMTSYLHLEHIDVARGASVGGGDRIGTSGTSGRPTVAEPHLHFGVRLAGSDNAYVDPLTLLPPLGGNPGAATPVPAEAPAPVRTQPAPVSIPARALHVGVPAPQRVRHPSLRPFPAPKVAAALPAPSPRAERSAPESLRGHAHALSPVPAGPRARSAGAGLRPGTETGATEAAPVQVGGGSATFGWGRFAFVAGLVLALTTALARPALRAAASVRRRADRRRKHAREAADAGAADVPVLLAQLQ